MRDMTIEEMKYILEVQNQKERLFAEKLAWSEKQADIQAMISFNEEREKRIAHIKEIDAKEAFLTRRARSTDAVTVGSLLITFASPVGMIVTPELFPSLMAVGIIGTVVSYIFGHKNRVPLREVYEEQARIELDAIIPGKVQPPSLQEQWSALEARYEAVISAWLPYETDVVEALTSPLMTDIACKETAAFHQSMNNATMLKNSKNRDDATTSRFMDAVAKMETAFSVAERNAKMNAWSGYSPTNQRLLQKAKDLMAIVLDEKGASLPERQAAYKSACKHIEGIIYLPRKALEVTAQKVNLAIEA